MKKLILLVLCCFSLRAQETIDRATRVQVANAVAHYLDVMYIEEETAPKLAAETKRRILSDAYDNLTPEAFVKKLTADLQEQTGDGHLYTRVRKEDLAMPAPTIAEADRNIEQLREMMRSPNGMGSGPVRIGASVMATADLYRKTNYGFMEARVLDGNVGLVRIDRFAPPLPEALAAADAAMTMIANTDAVIIDLRNAPGGVEAMATHVLSYFYAEPRKQLGRAHFRFANIDVESVTDENVPQSKRRPDVPLYILTSKDVTFSAAEFFAYSSQKFGRATIVGETTKGGGYAVQMVPIGRGMHLAISVGKPQHPLTKGGWQKVGVIPDLEASKADALQVALEAAQAKLHSPAPAAR